MEIKLVALYFVFLIGVDFSLNCFEMLQCNSEQLELITEKSKDKKNKESKTKNYVDYFQESEWTGLLALNLHKSQSTIDKCINPNVLEYFQEIPDPPPDLT